MADIGSKVTALHNMLADHLLQKLTGGEELTAAEIAQIRQFVKDNEGLMEFEKPDPLRDLEHELPSFEEDNIGLKH